MIDPDARAKTPSADRQRKPDEVVGVDEISGRRIQIELGKDAAKGIQLHAFTRPRPTPSNQTDGIPHPDGTDVCVPTRWVGDSAELATLITQESTRLLRIGQQRAEDMVLREEYRAGCLRLVHARAAARRANCLGLT